MGAVHPELDPSLRAFIARQAVCFVATAPLSADGHVNLSPKGLDTVRVLDGRTVAYLDLTGSGNETAAHLAENGRIVMMWCAFEGPPRIVRVHGRGRVVVPSDAAWPGLRAHFPAIEGVRQLVVVDVTRVATSCGYGVPTMGPAAARDDLVRSARTRGEEGLRAYRARKNRVSLDGLPAPEV